MTGEPLTRRSDDTVDKLRSRLKAFHRQTQPVIDHYERAGKTVTIDAKQDKNVRDPREAYPEHCTFFYIHVFYAETFEVFTPTR